MMNRIELAAGRAETDPLQTLAGANGLQPIACTPVAVACLAVAAAATAYYAVRDYNTTSFESRDDLDGVDVVDQASVGQLTAAVRTAVSK